MFNNSHSFDKNVPCRSTTPIDGNMRSRTIPKLVDHTSIYLYEIHYIDIWKQVLPFKELMVLWSFMDLFSLCTSIIYCDIWSENKLKVVEFDKDSVWQSYIWKTLLLLFFFLQIYELDYEAFYNLFLRSTFYENSLKVYWFSYWIE